MKQALHTLHRVARMRLFREQQNVVAAAAMLRSAEQSAERSEMRLKAALATADTAAVDFRAKPQCEQRRHLLAVTAERLQHAQDRRTHAEDERDQAMRRLSEARQAERRAETKSDAVAAQIASAARKADDRSTEREGEDRWTSPLTA